jgi:hypothetical protein
MDGGVLLVGHEPSRPDIALPTFPSALDLDSMLTGVSRAAPRRTRARSFIFIIHDDRSIRRLLAGNRDALPGTVSGYCSFSPEVIAMSLVPIRHGFQRRPAAVTSRERENTRRRRVGADSVTPGSRSSRTTQPPVLLANPPRRNRSRKPSMSCGHGGLDRSRRIRSVASW